jgi:ribulose-phosphate 3-epimerase
MEDQLSKIQHLRREIDQRHLKTSIVVDGGIDPKTAPLAVKSGATVLVAGSSIYNQSASVAKNVATLRHSIEVAVNAIDASPAERPALHRGLV